MDEIPQPPSTNPFMSYQPTIEDRRIGFGRRLGAWLLDVVGAWVVMIVLIPIISAIQPGQTEFMAASIKEMLTYLKSIGIPREVYKDALPYILPALYADLLSPILYWSIEAFTGASPGKRILGMRVMREDGAPAQPSIIAMRTAIKISDKILKLIAILYVADVIARGVTSAASLVSIVITIGCFMVLSAKKQALHDMIARTAIFRTNEPL